MKNSTVEKEKIEAENRNDEISKEYAYSSRKNRTIGKPHARLLVVEFNLQGYGSNVMKDLMVKYLCLNDRIDFSSRKNIAMTHIKIHQCRFLDILNCAVEIQLLTLQAKAPSYRQSEHAVL